MVAATRTAWVVLVVGFNVCVTVKAQTIEYDVTLLPQIAGSFSTVPLEINNSGVVVGMAQFQGDPFFARGWRWSVEDGMTMLPPPPGEMSLRYAPSDINDSGVIAGGGGFDSGVVWRLEDGVYTILGTLPGFIEARAGGMNNFGDVVATTSAGILIPPRAFLVTSLGVMVDLFPDLGGSRASDINDAGQIVANGIGLVVPAVPQAMRIEPDGTRTVLPVPEGFVNFGGGSINELGDIAGVARCSHECNRVFLYTDAGEMLEIPAVGSRHILSGLTNDRRVVGGVTEGVAQGWIWTEQQGTRILDSLIDPNLTLLITRASGINEAGQIIAYGVDYSDSVNPRRIMLLTPVAPALNGDCDGTGDVNLVDFATFSNCFGLTAPSAVCDATDFACCDLDQNGAINLVDFATFATNFNG